MDALGYRAPQVPGMDSLYGAGGRVLTAFPFVADGVAWVTLGDFPTVGRFGPQWEEVTASRAVAARERFLDRMTDIARG